MAKANAKFMAPLTPSAELAAVVGATPLPRTEIVKKMWEYIKKNGLQDQKNKRMINSDAKLAAIFEVSLRNKIIFPNNINISSFSILKNIILRNYKSLLFFI